MYKYYYTFSTKIKPTLTITKPMLAKPKHYMVKLTNILN